MNYQTFTWLPGVPPQMSPGICGGINQLLERSVDYNPVTQALKAVKPSNVSVGDLQTSNGIIL
jgi:hypothetical protein